MDDEVDALDEKIQSQIARELALRNESVEWLIPLLMASHHLERVADHATNIAEDVIYMVEGDIVRHYWKEDPLDPSRPADYGVR